MGSVWAYVPSSADDKSGSDTVYLSSCEETEIGRLRGHVRVVTLRKQCRNLTALVDGAHHHHRLFHADTSLVSAAKLSNSIKDVVFAHLHTLRRWVGFH
jgi:hypothetical protein